MCHRANVLGAESESIFVMAPGRRPARRFAFERRALLGIVDIVDRHHIDVVMIMRVFVLMLRVARGAGGFR
jgi:hypothetical protein